MAEQTRSVKVAVIGAGMSGLVAIRELQREGHWVVAFEKGDQLGGTWVYDQRVECDPLGLDPGREIVHSSMYRSLRTNLPRQVMGFSDYPFLRKEGGDPRNFPGHEEVLRFLSDFADDFGLLGSIRFRHEVVRVAQVEGGKPNGAGWAVEWRTSTGEVAEEVFQAAVVCSGKSTQPRIAEFPGRATWPGEQIHSHNYRIPEPFRNRIVLIIGKGPSAIDTAIDILPLAKEVHASRSVNPDSFELHMPKGVFLHDMVRCAEEDGKVVFEDGSFTYPDVIIHCTGYSYHFPFLETNGLVTVEENCVGPLYKHVFSPRLAPGLSFIGLTYRTHPPLVSELQSKWVAKVLSGKLLLPSEEEMMSSVEEHYQRLKEVGWPKHHTHRLHLDKFDYEKWLMDQVGLPPMEKWRENIFYVLLKLLMSMPGENLRDTWDVDQWIQEEGSEQEKY